MLLIACAHDGQTRLTETGLPGCGRGVHGAGITDGFERTEMSGTEENMAESMEPVGVGNIDLALRQATKELAYTV